MRGIYIYMYISNKNTLVAGMTQGKALTQLYCGPFKIKFHCGPFKIKLKF